MTVPFKPEPWLADWIGRAQADASAVAPRNQLPPVPTIGADNTRPGEREALRRAYDNPQVKLGRALQAAQIAAEFEPGVIGSVASLGAAVREGRAGNPGMAALSAAGALPLVPGLAAGAKAAKKGKKALPKLLGATVRAEDGRVFTGPTHGHAIMEGENAGATFSGLIDDEGFIHPTKGNITRHQAKKMGYFAKAEKDINQTVQVQPGAEIVDELPADIDAQVAAIAAKYSDAPPAARKAAKLIGKDANEDVLSIAEAMIRNEPMPRVTQVDAEKAARMAKVYEGLPKFDPEAKAAYDLLNEEVAAQAKAIQDAGYRFEFVDSDPYANSAEMMKDVRENKRLKVFKTPTGEGSTFHPYMTPEQNDTFRAVHDWIAHAGPGNQFGPIGEENAYRMHAATLSPQAQRALASETRGQNSWVNFGPNAHLPVKERPFAEQKAALWPEEWLGDYDKMPAGESALPRVYHGTKADFDVFEPSAGGELGKGIYFTDDPNTAGKFASMSHGQGSERIISAHLDMKRPFITDSREAVRSKGPTRLQKEGYDGVIYTSPTGEKQYLVFKPEQVKQEVAPKIEAPQLKLGSEKPALDESNLKLVPDYVTDPTERAPLYRPPRADLSHLTPMWKRVTDVFAKNADQGLREGLGAWYDVSPLRRAFLDESATGQEDFELAMKLLGPTSSGTVTPQNIKQGSLMYFLSGDPVKFLDDLRAGSLDIPKGYANRRQSSVNSGVRRILEEGDLNPIEQPKTFRYGNIPTGRYFHSVPLDMHVGRQTGRKGVLVKEDGSMEPGRGFPMPSYAKDKKVATSPPKTSYTAIEDRILAEAEKRGVPGAPFMAAGWVKGGMPDAIGGSTNVADLRGLIPLFNERIALTAQKRGISRAEALRGFIQKKWPLAAIGGLGAGQGLLMSGAHSDDGM